MRMLPRLGLAVAVANGLLSANQEPPTRPSTGTVIVTVLEAGTRAPISGAHLSGGSWDGGVTGADPKSVPIFYPSETSPVKAAAIVLRASETADLKIVVRSVAPVPISGSVLDANGRPVQGEPLGPLAMQQPPGVVDLWYRRLDRDCCPHTTSNHLIEIGPDGRFRTEPLPPGRYLFAAGKYWVTVVHESRAIDDVVIRMERPAIVRGAVTPPLEWGTSRGPGSVSLQPIESAIVDHLVGGNRTDALPDGSFAIAAVPGHYRLRFYSPDPGMIVQHIWLDDGRDVADATVDLKPGEVRENVRVTMTDRLARIVGRIGPPFLLGPRGFSVIAFPADPQHRHDDCSLVRRSENEEADGLFFLEKLLPGFDYFVAVYPRGERQPSLNELSKTAVRLSVNDATIYKIDVDLAKR